MNHLTIRHSFLTLRTNHSFFHTMRHLKLPIIVTCIVLLLALIVGIAMVTWIHRSKISNEQKTERAQKFGGGLAVTTCLIIAPFWFIAAARVGKERRASREGKDGEQS